MLEERIALSHSMIASSLQGECRVSILLSVYNAGSAATGPLLLIGDLQHTFSRATYSCDGGESWREWQQSCAIDSIESREEALLLLQGVFGEQVCSQELLLELISPNDGSVYCRTCLVMPALLGAGTAQCRYLSYDGGGKRRCCSL